MANSRLKELFEQFLGERMSKAELKELRLLVRDEGNADELDNLLKNAYSDPRLTIGTDYEIDAVFEEMMKKVRKSESPKVRKMWWKVAAAAVILIALGLWFLKGKVPRSARNDKEIVQVQDVKAPDSTKATITLANGKVILPVVKDGKVDIVKETEYNILNNPRGSKVVSLTLSDGTIAWLNAESSIKYPTSFDHTERVVEITGEAYFECKTPHFKVKANGVVIEDLGTEFNVNSYESTVTTLVKGKVKIGSVVMKPGEQASGEKLVASGVDVEEVMAWRNGRFSYKGADIETIMKEVARWYDVEVSYEGKIDEKFYADVSRESNVSTLFKIFEATKAIKFKIEGKKVTVLK